MAKIGIITTASADPLDSATFYEALFMEQYGAASATWIPVTETSGNADTQEVSSWPDSRSSCCVRDRVAEVRGDQMVLIPF